MNETWECTNRLRWVNRAVEVEPGIGQMEQELQQLWHCRETGETEWRDVPVERQE